MVPTDEPSDGAAESDASSAPEQAGDGKSRKLVKGLVFGIGSAALVAALLYAGRNKSKKTPWS